MSQGGREPDDLRACCCRKADCPAHGQRGKGNRTVPLRDGPRQRRLLR
jgi:hypothetical protein